MLPTSATGGEDFFPRQGSLPKPGQKSSAEMVPDKNYMCRLQGPITVQSYSVIFCRAITALPLCMLIRGLVFRAAMCMRMRSAVHAGNAQQEAHKPRFSRTCKKVAKSAPIYTTGPMPGGNKDPERAPGYDGVSQDTARVAPCHGHRCKQPGYAGVSQNAGASRPLPWTQVQPAGCSIWRSTYKYYTCSLPPGYICNTSNF